MTTVLTDTKVETPPVVVTQVEAPVVTQADKLFPKVEAKPAEKPPETPPPEQKPADLSPEDKAKQEQAAKDKEAADKKVADDAAAKAKAEAVVYDLKAPEGIEAKSVEQFTEVAKEMKLTPADAQKLVDWYAKTAQAKGQDMAKVWEDTNTGWVNSAKADKEIGGDKFDASVTGAKQALAKFGNDGFKEALSLTGMGNHPEMVRFLFKVSKAMAEDKPVTGQTAGEKPASIAKLLFPNQN